MYTTDNTIYETSEVRSFSWVSNFTDLELQNLLNANSIRELEANNTDLRTYIWKIFDSKDPYYFQAKMVKVVFNQESNTWKGIFEIKLTFIDKEIE